MKIIMMMLMKSVPYDFDKVVLQFFYLIHGLMIIQQTVSVCKWHGWHCWHGCHGKTLVNDFFNYDCKIYNIY